MTRFAYLAVDRDGRERSGVDAAPDEAALRARLLRKNLVLLKVDPQTDPDDASRPARAITPVQRPEAARASASGARLTPREHMLAVRQLATLLEASAPAAEALSMIAAQQERPKARLVLLDVLDGVLEGQRLSDAMARQPRSFSALVRATVAGGERSGQLGAVLTRLADTLAKQSILRGKIGAALAYPIVLSIVATLVIICLMAFVVPPLMEQFKGFNTPLPLITQIVMAVSGFVSAAWPFLAISVVAGVFGGRALLKQPVIAQSVDGLLLRLPLLGARLRDLDASRFARAGAALVGSGLPVLDSVRMSGESVANRVMRAHLSTIAANIEAGEALSAAMRKSGAFPAMLVYMIASGENAGALATMLEKAADHFDQEFESFAAATVSLIEPAIIVVMGAVAATIVLSIMLPILQLNSLAIG